MVGECVACKVIFNSIISHGCSTSPKAKICQFLSQMISSVARGAEAHCYRHCYVQCKWPLPLATRAILGSDPFFQSNEHSRRSDGSSRGGGGWQWHPTLKFGPALAELVSRRSTTDTQDHHCTYSFLVVLME